ncbi:antibiotic biosynthesis monooxygenase [Pendulispora brunnea]|uniref:Antibiotic biosynthesis monooxygenase n=1 Tax=Pendulispora brunnea TaxID=2905690 RepID=A0ABZ2K3Q0_9BACT
MRCTTLLTSLLLSCAVLATACASTPSATSPGTVTSSPSTASKRLIARVWHGRTAANKADEYARYLDENGVKKILAIEGNRGCQMFRRIDGEVAEFFVISYWESRDAIKKFAGADIEKTHNLPRDPEFLLELEPQVRHFDVIVGQSP